MQGKCMPSWGTHACVGTQALLAPHGPKPVPHTAGAGQICMVLIVTNLWWGELGSTSSLPPAGQSWARLFSSLGLSTPLSQQLRQMRVVVHKSFTVATCCKPKGILYNRPTFNAVHWGLLFYECSVKWSPASTLHSCLNLGHWIPKVLLPFCLLWHLQTILSMLLSGILLPWCLA